jgi:hypothetical protein
MLSCPPLPPPNKKYKPYALAPTPATLTPDTAISAGASFLLRLFPASAANTRRRQVSVDQTKIRCSCRRVVDNMDALGVDGGEVW